jgi:uncharacterized protein DUF5309
MAVLAGMATSYDLPQYIGQLFRKDELQFPNAWLRLIGGLTGALGLVGTTQFVMGVDYSLPAAAQPAVVEGADPVFEEQDVTAQGENVVQIFQEGIKVAYSKRGNTGAVSGIAVIPGSQTAGKELILPGSLPFQIDARLAKVARNANLSFLKGAYQKPANNATGRKTRGVITAITTNVFANGGNARPLTKPIFENALRDSMANGQFAMGATLYALGDKTQVDALINLYKSDTRLPESREVVGVSVRTIITTWATVNVVWEPDMPAGQLAILRPELCAVVAMPIPDKGVLFVEPVAKTGAYEAFQLYGELGIDYKHEVFHSIIKDLS